MTSGVAALHGALLAYDVAGTGQPLVFIHGGLVDRRVWDDQFSAFAQDYRVLRYDVRGYGASSVPTEPFSHLDDLDQLLTLLEIDRAHLVGLSTWRIPRRSTP